MRVLVIDDDEISLDLLRHTLAKAGYDVHTAQDGQQAWEYLRDGEFRLVISDWNMPGIDGEELCRRVRQRSFSHYVYIILVTVRDGAEDVVRGLKAGADDFITKPFEPTELCVRVRAGERILSLDSRDVTIFSLAKLADSRDPETGAHLERMREYCQILARHMSHQEKFSDVVDGEFIRALYLTSPLHDIGKVGIPDCVLLKAGDLTERETAIMRSHTLLGAETLSAAARLRPEAGFLQMASDIALTHHERFDGSGYPHGLAGEAIPLCGRIVALADVYDALTTQRVYKPAFSPEVAHSIIVEERGKHFDPDIVDCFLEVEDKFLEVYHQLQNATQQQLCADIVAEGMLQTSV
jgi:putative two-component system response regulator